MVRSSPLLPGPGELSLPPQGPLDGLDPEGSPGPLQVHGHKPPLPPDTLVSGPGGGNWYVCGLDPGKTGGIVLLSGVGEILLAEPMPVEKGHGRAVDIDVRAIRVLVGRGKLLRPRKVFIELVGPVPGSSRQSAFTFGRYLEALLSLCKLEGWPYDLLPPKVWQAGLLRGSYQGKSSVASWARRNYPDLQTDHDGIIDALAIATYGLRRES